MTAPTDHVARAEVATTAPPHRVWQVLTDPAEVARWMSGTTLETDWEVGSPVTWSGEYDGTPYQDSGEVLEVVEDRRLRVTHRSGMSEDAEEHVLDYRLEPDGDGTRLVLEQGGNSSAEQAEQFTATWQQMLDAAKETAEAP